MSVADLQPETGSLEGSGGRRTLAAVTVLASGVALAVLAHVALRTDTGQRLDERAMNAVVAGREAHLTVLSVLGYVSIGAIALVAVVCLALAVLRGRILLAVVALGVIVGANVTTQLLKRVLLERAELSVIAPNSLPSGHTTVVAACMGALCLVSPRVLRALVVPLGAFATTLTGASTVVAGWHRPSDVVAAVLVSLAWTAAGGLLIGGVHRSVPGLWLGAVAGSVLGLVSLVAIGVRPSFGWSGFAEAALVLGVVAALTALGAVLMDEVGPTSSD